MQHCVFIHTNHKQILGAIVAEYALRRFSTHNDQFDVRTVNINDFPWFAEFEGQDYLRGGVKRPWLNEDLQSFTPLRFMPPEAMGYAGRSVVIDPDIFAVADVWDLLNRDMQGKAVMCRMRHGPEGFIRRCQATSVMLMDNAKLQHWKVEERFRAMFSFDVDYRDWICLKLEQADTIGHIEAEWNDFDKLTTATRMLHTTRRKTQPWKTGLAIDWRPADTFPLFPPIGWMNRARRKLFGEYGLLGNYQPHPDPNQERLFFGLLKECVEQGIVSEDMVRHEMAENHVRHDAFEVLDRIQPLAAMPNPPMPLPTPSR